MRTPTYISPSGLKTFLDSPDDYYLKYLSDHQPMRSPQTQAMSVGSAFDAKVKSALFERLIGKGDKRWPIYEPTAIFEAQVEPHNRDWARDAGDFVFDRYNKSGCLADLMIDMGKAASEPQFEVSIAGTVESRIGLTRQGVPLYGKPDVFFINNEGAHIVLDWKVNGFCAKTDTSPAQGYKLCRDTWGPEDKTGVPRSRNHWEPHKRYHGVTFKGIEINAILNLEDVSEDWAIQLSTYSWLFGERVGVEVVTAIDQICGRRPCLRIAQHRAKVSSEYQHKIMGQYADLWNRITSGHFFRELSKADSDAKCANLDEQSKILYGPGRTEEDEIFLSLTGSLNNQYRPRR